MKLLYFIFFFISICSLQRCTEEKAIIQEQCLGLFDLTSIDSIYIKQTDFNILTIVSISRETFESYYNEEGNTRKLTTKGEIQGICSLVNDLEEDSNKELPMPYESMKIERVLRGQVVWFNKDPLDVRAQIIIYTKEKNIILWISQFYVDSENMRFKMSEALYNFLQNEYIK